MLCTKLGTENITKKKKGHYGLVENKNFIWYARQVGHRVKHLHHQTPSETVTRVQSETNQGAHQGVVTNTFSPSLSYIHTLQGRRHKRSRLAQVCSFGLHSIHPASGEPGPDLSRLNSPGSAPHHHTGRGTNAPGSSVALSLWETESNAGMSKRSGRTHRPHRPHEALESPGSSQELGGGLRIASRLEAGGENNENPGRRAKEPGSAC